MQTFSRSVAAVLLSVVCESALCVAQPGSNFADHVTSPATLRSPTPAFAETAMVFTADPHISDGFWQPLYAAIRLGMIAQAPELRSVRVVSQPLLLRRSEFALGNQFPLVLQVRLQGRCDVPVQAAHFMTPGPLGWVLLVQGEIQPFIYVNCTRLAQVLNPLTLDKNATDRQRLFDSAIAKIILHEWIHFASQSPCHSRHGLMQEQLSNRELTAARCPVTP